MTAKKDSMTVLILTISFLALVMFGMSDSNIAGAAIQPYLKNHMADKVELNSNPGEVNLNTKNSYNNNQNNLITINRRTFSINNCVPGIINVKLKSKISNLEEYANSRSINFEKINYKLSKSKLQKNKELKKQIGLDRWVKVKIPTNSNLKEELEKWISQSDVETVECEFESTPIYVPNDPLFPDQWEHRNLGNNPGPAPSGTFDADIDTVEAWDATFTNEVLVVNFENTLWNHEDLAQSVWQNLAEDGDNDGSVLECPGPPIDCQTGITNFILDSGDNNKDKNNDGCPGVCGVDDDNDGLIDEDSQGLQPGDVGYSNDLVFDDDENGLIDDLIGWNIETNTNQPDVSNPGHGTLTAGFLLATRDNNLGVSGTCPNCKFMSVSGFGFSSIADKIIHAVDNGVSIISLSLLITATQNIEDAIDYATANGVSIIAGAGNDGIFNENEICQFNEVICVSATNNKDEPTTFENTFGAWASAHGSYLDISAPGIYLTYISHLAAEYGYPGSGTSISTPIVSGVVGMVKSINPTLTPSEVISVIKSTSDPINNFVKYYGTGRLNAKKAVDAAANVIGSFPVANVDGANSQSAGNTFVLRGDAYSSATDVKIYVGEGLLPNDFTLIDSHTNPVMDGIISNININDLPAMINTIKLEVNDGEETAIDYFYPVLKTNTLNVPGLLYASPVFGNIDSDEDLEIITTSNTNGLYLINQDGTFGVSPFPLSGTTATTHAAGDVDNDGDLEIAVLGINENLYLFHHDGTIQAGFPRFVDNSGLGRPPIVADIDNDNQKEIISGSSNGDIYIVKNDGTLLNSQVLATSSNARSIAVANFNLDQNLEIAVAGGTGYDLIDINGNSLPGWPIAGSGSSNAKLTAGDLNSDAIPEIIIGDGTNIRIYDSLGNSLVEPPISLNDQIEMNIALSDLDRDGDLEVVAGDTSGYIYVFNHDGTIYNANWPIKVNDFNPMSPILADLDADSDLEVFAISKEFILFPAEAFAWNLDGSIVDDVWNFEVGTIGFFQGPGIADLDNDNDYEVMAGTNQNNLLYIWDNHHKIDSKGGWLMSRYDKENTGHYPSCSDGTIANICTGTKPLYCDAEGNLINDCTTCGCPVGKCCKVGGTCGACFGGSPIFSKDQVIQQ